MSTAATTNYRYLSLNVPISYQYFIYVCIDKMSITISIFSGTSVLPSPRNVEQIPSAQVTPEVYSSAYVSLTKADGSQARCSPKICSVKLQFVSSRHSTITELRITITVTGSCNAVDVGSKQLRWMLFWFNVALASCPKRDQLCVVRW